MVRIEALECRYGDRVVIRDFSSTFPKGEISALSGRSGIGKSTLLKAINRLHETEEGSFSMRGHIYVTLKGREMDILEMDPVELRRGAGYIFQSPIPLPMSIYKNVRFALDVAGIKDNGEAERALMDVGLWDEVKQRLKSPADSLSLGQQQRLAIARVLVMQPEILLFDEPASSLDHEATLRIEEIMVKLKRNRTVILVSHDQAQIERVADRIVELPDIAQN